MKKLKFSTTALNSLVADKSSANNQKVESPTETNARDAIVLHFGTRSVVISGRVAVISVSLVITVTVVVTALYGSPVA